MNPVKQYRRNTSRQMEDETGQFVVDLNLNGTIHVRKRGGHKRYEIRPGELFRVAERMGVVGVAPSRAASPEPSEE